MRRFCELVNAFLEAGYAFQKFHPHPTHNTIFLRHDVDFSLDAAVQMARQEKELGVSSTYFFLLSSSFYNLLSEEGKSCVNDIAAMGHDVSIHFDPTLYESVEDGFRFEKFVFDGAFDVEARIVSLHRPRGFLDNRNRRLPGVRHTYEDPFFCKMHYFSDSRGEFRHGHPLESEAFSNGYAIHLLLHPIWWVSEQPTASAKLQGWIDRRADFLADEVARNCDIFERT
jgi:hypothetical protein